MEAREAARQALAHRAMILERATQILERFRLADWWSQSSGLAPTQGRLAIRAPDAMTEAELRRRSRILFMVLTILGLRWPSQKPELVQMLRWWLGSWAGMGHVTGAMARQGYDVQLTRHGDAGWRATFYPSGKEYSIVPATAWERTPGRAVQLAAWRALNTRGPLMGW